jgi:hypothetical protein
MPAIDLYAGRGLIEARRAAENVGGRLIIISAGLGLVAGETAVPAYSLTTISGDPDDIRLKTASGRPDWWEAIQRASPFATPDPRDSDGMILAAVSSAYLDMIGTEWSQWSDADLARLRLFSKSPPRDAARRLRSAWMPYDDRLDAIVGLAGTQGDFAQRAMRHFATEIRSGSQEADAAAVLHALAPLPRRARPANRRRDDAEIKGVIREEWTRARGQSAAMLRHLRDTLGLACEQGRFRTLFNEVKAEKTP